MIINILQNIDESEKIEIIKDPSTLKDYLDEIAFRNQKNMIKNLLNDAKSHFHRVPKVIKPVLISIYSEINLRMKNLDKVKN